MDKKEQITTNIMQLAETLNARYGNIIPKEKVGEAIERFSGSEEDYDILRFVNNKFLWYYRHTEKTRNYQFFEILVTMCLFSI